MLLTDLFSHKIHSSGNDWPNKLIDIASIFNEFDGKPYDRAAIEKRLSEVSPRASKVARDPSKFRDEISAYPAYLGLYRIELVGGVWHIFLSDTAKHFLVSEEPDVAAFMLLQLILFQYPSGMGIAYTANSSTVRIQSNARDRTLKFVKNRLKLSPFRLICKSIQADSILKEISPLNAQIKPDEIFVLANTPSIYQNISPSSTDITEVLKKYREGKIDKPEQYEKRFHILRHTNFLTSDRNGIRIRESLNEEDSKELIEKLNTINKISAVFNGFDYASSADDLLDQIRKCSWGKYFDGLTTLSSTEIKNLTTDSEDKYIKLATSKRQSYSSYEVRKATATYHLKKYTSQDDAVKQKTKKRTIYTDPEVTKIRRQRANLVHKIVLDKLNSYLEAKGAKAFENEHIDLYAQLPSNEKFIFEVKSISQQNVLSQSRKGLSQLYEYRYRYQKQIGYDVNLFLVFPEEPKTVPWLQEYLCTDRDIGVVWFEGDTLVNSTYCEELASQLKS
jgi:hypothetical protein